MPIRDPQLRLKRLYHARGSDGETYEVHVYVHAPPPGAKAHIERLALVSLSSGQSLQVLAKGTYQIPGTDVTLHADDPEAV